MSAVLKTVTSTEQFLALKSAWNNLTEEPLRSFDWNFSWWQSFGKGCELRVYCFSLDGVVVGIAPFFVDRWIGQQRLRFLGSGATCTDYAQIISLPEHRERFVTEIAADIKDSTSISIVELDGVCGVAEDELICEKLANTFRRYEGDLEPAWVLNIPESWEQFIRQSKQSLRRKVKKALKRLDSGEVQVHSTRNELKVESAFDVLVALHQERFISKGKAGVFSDERFENFLRHAVVELCGDQRAEILVGYSGDIPIVSQLYLIGETGPQLYQSGVRTDAMKMEPGHLLFTYAVRSAIENGFPTFDFLRGNEPYKPYWGAIPRPLWNIRCVSKDLMPTTIDRTFSFLRSLKRGYSNLISRELPTHATKG